MGKKTSSAAALVAPRAQTPPEPEAAEQPVTPLAARLQRAFGECLRVAAAALVGYTLAATAWRVRHDPQELAFVVGCCVLLAALLVCLRRAERLAPGSPVAERRRLQAAVWFLTTVLSCAFAYRVSLAMPDVLVVLVWCMTAFVVLAGFFMLVLCNRKDQQYHRCLDEVDASDDKPFDKIRHTDGLV
ncbi:unnamed protein product [Urochloa decumbens]|uniref:Uncharacterized protein n=1 Tax=Urochloa decumbens TaxID=240449 RepID=A0ABC8WIF6_9POAL